MNQNVNSQSNFLRTSREFPNDIDKLSFEVDKSYVDVANAVNNRTIGVFPTNRSVVTGESWFVNKNARQQTFRQVYNITSYASIPHNINFSSVFSFTVIRAVGFDGTNYFPIPFVNGASSVSVYVTPTLISFTPSGTAPVLVRGIVILEWLSNA